jgi:branched-chain amino acid aminotransferase
MRKYLLQRLRKDNIPVEECAITPEDVAQASELFLTNAIQSIRWVKQSGNTQYTNAETIKLYQKYVAPLFI